MPPLIITTFVTLCAAYALYSIPTAILQVLQMSTVPLSVFSKLPQISYNYKARSTGQLSTFAVLAQIAGCVARVFTTFVEVGDPIVLAGFLVALLLNVVLGVQMWLYWGKGEEEPILLDKQPLSQLPPQKIDVVVTSSAPITPSTSAGRRWSRKLD